MKILRWFPPSRISSDEVSSAARRPDFSGEVLGRNNSLLPFTTARLSSPLAAGLARHELSLLIYALRFAKKRGPRPQTNQLVPHRVRAEIGILDPWACLWPSLWSVPESPASALRKSRWHQSSGRQYRACCRLPSLRDR